VSIAIPVDQLPAAVAQRPFAYVVTVSAEGQAHVLAVQVVVEGHDLLMDVGRRTSANVGAGAEVMLVFPPVEPNTPPVVEHAAYSLVVDGTGAVADGRLRVHPTAAVMHRPAPPFTRSTASVATATADPRSTS
jgi:hypothetical protein